MKKEYETNIQLELENGDVYYGGLCNEAEEIENESKGKFITLDNVKKNGKAIYYIEDQSKALDTIRIRKDKIVAYMTYKKSDNI